MAEKINAAWVNDLLYGGDEPKLVSLHTAAPIVPLRLVCPQCGATDFRIETEYEGPSAHLQEQVPAFIECTVCDTEWTTKGEPRALYPNMIQHARKHDSEHTLVEMFARDFAVDTRPPKDWHWLCSCGTRVDSLPGQVEALDSWRAHRKEAK